MLTKKLRNMEESDLEWIVAQEREVQELKLSIFLRDGHVYDPVLKQVVYCEEEGPAE